MYCTQVVVTCKTKKNFRKRTHV